MTRPAEVLRWGVRSSFVRYVSALPDGRISASGGAGFAEQNVWFPETNRTDAAIRRFTGSVIFTAHFGLLSVIIADPWLDWSTDICALTIADSDHGRVPIATCLVASHPTSRAWLGREVRVTEQGAALFGGSYAVGEPLADFTVALVGPLADGYDTRLTLADATAP